MGALIGFAVGFYYGTRTGEEGLQELLEAWETIRTSEEVRDLVSGGSAALVDLVHQGREMLVGRLKGDSAPALQRVA
jgi:hypothetical protein